MKKTHKSKMLTESRSSESKMGVEVLHTFTFPEHSMSFKAVDLTDAKKLLQKRLKGEKHYV